jgi:hypothetical protein
MEKLKVKARSRKPEAQSCNLKLRTQNLKPGSEWVRK